MSETLTIANQEAVQPFEQEHTAAEPLTVDSLIEHSEVGVLKRALASYLTPKNPEAAIKFHERVGTPSLRKLLMNTLGSLRSGKEEEKGSNYHIGSEGNLMDQMAKFAFSKSVKNEIIHSAAASGSVLLSMEAMGGDKLISAAWLGSAALNGAIVAVQRYNRARTVRAINKGLAKGDHFSPDYTNRLGIDAQAQINAEAAQQNTNV